MKNKIKTFWAGLIMLLMIFQPVFVTAGVPEAVTYLQAQTQDAWITMALAAAGQSGIPTAHLASVSGSSATDYAKAILALAAVDEDPSTFGTVDYVAQLKTYYSGGQIGDSGLLNDDIWSIIALASVGEVGSTQAISAKDFILANQNVDGGWSYAVGADSDTNDTAAAIMALIEAGVNAGNSVITNALAYLQTAQNIDGGIGYTPGSDSDSGSDSWVISALNKAGINPTTWDKTGNNPITHLESLQDADGGFWWVAEGTSEWNNKAMTAYAVIALANKSYPVGYYEGGGAVPGTFHLRIEGADSTICDSYISGTTALDVIENGAEICGYTYAIDDTVYGPYLSAINDEAAAGMAGWLYFVNNVSPPVGAGDYILAEGDEILWYYGEWGWNPTRLTVNAVEIDPGDTLEITAEYFNGTDWLILPNANIRVNDDDRAADAGGGLLLTINDNGIFRIYVETDNFVRSEKVTVTVGDTVSQTVGLRVEVVQEGGIVIGDSIALVVSPDQINFGTLAPGESAQADVTLTNEGTVGLLAGATVTGDAVFVAGIKINGSGHQEYSESLASGEIKTAGVSLNVPISYLDSGVKNGELIFWAVVQ